MTDDIGIHGRVMTYVTTYGVRAQQHVNHLQHTEERFRNRLAGFSPLSRISSVLSNDRPWLSWFSIVSYPPQPRLDTLRLHPFIEPGRRDGLTGVVMLAVSVIGQGEAGRVREPEVPRPGAGEPGMQIPGSNTGQKSEVIHKPQVTGDGVVTTPFSNSPHLIGEKLSRSGNDLQLESLRPWTLF